jgi:hypothetical protein
MGMAIAGACPGMVLSQIGSGVQNSGLTVAGGLLGQYFVYMKKQNIYDMYMKNNSQFFLFFM